MPYKFVNDKKRSGIDGRSTSRAAERLGLNWNEEKICDSICSTIYASSFSRNIKVFNCKRL